MRTHHINADPRRTAQAADFKVWVTRSIIGMFCLCIGGSVYAQSPAPPSATTVEGCAEACAKKHKVAACVSLDDMKECFNGDVPECKGIGSGDLDVAARACAICANLPPSCAPTASPPVVAPATSGDKPKPSPRRLTEKELCNQKRNHTYVEEPVLTEAGEPTGEVKKHCFSLQKAHDWLVDLERAVRQIRSGTKTGLSPEDVEKLKQLLRSEGLTPEMQKRFGELKTDLANDIDRLKQHVERVERTANQADVNADRAHQRIDDIENGKTRIPGQAQGTHPQLLFSLVGSIHTSRTVNQDFLWLGGGEVKWMPWLTRDLALAFLGGVGAGHHHGTSDTFVFWTGAGLAGPAFFSDDVLMDGMVYYQHWPDDATDDLNFYGVAGSFTWMPGVSSRRSFIGSYTDPNDWNGEPRRNWEGKRKTTPIEGRTVVYPGFGLRAAVGSSRMTAPDGVRTGYVDGELAAHVSLGF